jgi:hypothetical protein
MNTKRLVILGWLLLVLGTPDPTAAYDLTWHTVDGGGSSSAANGYSLSGTIGQPDTDTSAAGSLQLIGGFWTAAAVPALPGDCNGDGHVDADDFALLQSCLLGPDAGPQQNCPCFDLDADDDVDLRDLAAFQTSFTGS